MRGATDSPVHAVVRADPRDLARSQRWAILTGEYPPQPGGVSDYTRRIASALAARGDDVHIWAPPCERESQPTPGVSVRRLRDCFGARGLRQLTGALDAEPGRRILVQYVPHAFGHRGMNIGFCSWLFARRGVDAIWTMFHEVTYPWSLSQLPQHNVLSLVNRGMATLVARASRRVFVSTTAWAALLKPMLMPRVVAEPLPIPSNIDTQADPQAVARLREKLGPLVLGHFGTFGPSVAPLLRRLLIPLLRAVPGLRLLLLGRGAGVFAAALDGSMSERITAAENLSAEHAAVHLAACDLTLQPYPDGATTRRSSLMAALALGVPVVTTTGHLSEPIWHETGAVSLAPVADEGALVRLTVELLGSPADRRELAVRGRSLYEARFALGHTIDRLRSATGAKL